MKIFEFNKYFPDEATCRRKFKEMRDKEGVTCQHCASHDVVWLESKQQYQCKHCRHRTTLRSGTVMHGSKLPFHYWFIAMHLLTATKKSISAAELQRQLGHNRYQPCVWYGGGSPTAVATPVGPQPLSARMGIDAQAALSNGQA